MFKRPINPAVFGIMAIIKIVVFVLIVVLATIFFLQNSDPAVVHFPFSRPQHIGMVYLLLVTFFVGVIVGVAVTLIVGKKIKKMRESEIESDEFELIDEK